MQVDSEIVKLQNDNKVNEVKVSEIRAISKKIAVLLESGELKNIKQIIEMYVNKIEVISDKAIVYLYGKCVK